MESSDPVRSQSDDLQRHRLTTATLILYWSWLPSKNSVRFHDHIARAFKCTSTPFLYRNAGGDLEYISVWVELFPEWSQ